MRKYIKMLTVDGVRLYVKFFVFILYVPSRNTNDNDLFFAKNCSTQDNNP